MSESAIAPPDKGPLDKLLWDLKVTAGCRFNAAARLGRRDKRSNVLVSVYSALLICVSIATFALPLGSATIRYASFAGIVASILLLVMSMRNFAHQFAVDAEQMHRCALEINELRRVVASLPREQAERDLPEYVRTYNLILQKWSINHSEEDFLRYKYKHKWEFQDIRDVADKDLPNRRFQEYSDVSVGGIVLLTALGVMAAAFVAYMLWDSLAPLGS